MVLGGDGIHHPEGEGHQVAGVTGDVEEKLSHILLLQRV